MSCPAPETFGAFVSGSLAAAERDALEVHVDECASCRVILSELGRSSHAAMALPSLTERVGRYEIIGELGAGAMGVVYRARDPELDREVAIKLVQPQPGAPEAELVAQRTLREGRALARIDHANVVRVFDVGRWDGGLFVAMERAAGVSLRVWLETARTPAQIIDVLAQCARGLAAAHAAGVIHRDFKPDNVIVDERGHARVTDFGLAQTDRDDVRTVPAGDDVHDIRLTRTRGIVGTPAYMAPEQHRGESLDARADQFAWGVTLAEALTGDRPFAAATLDALKAPPVLPAQRRVRRVLERALAFDPAQRFSSMTDVVTALRPRRVWPWLAAAVVIAGIAGVAGAFMLRERDACAGVDAAIDATWTAARRDKLAATFAAGPPFGTRAWAYAASAIDKHASAWKTARVGVCRAGVERGEVDAGTRAKTVHCLERRIVELEAVLARWERIGADANAPEIVDRLASPAACATADAPAPTAAESARTKALEARFAAAIVAADAGQPLEAEPLLVALERELVDHPALRAEVLVRLSGVERDLGKRDAAHAHLVTALAVAEGARADRARVRAWLGLAQSSADDFAKVDEAKDALRLAGAVLAHVGDPALSRLHDTVRGLVAVRANDTAEAVAAFRAGLDDPTLKATERAQRLQMLARALIASGDHAGALAELERASALLVEALGPDAPQLVYVLNTQMDPLEYLGRAREAIAAGERALALIDASYGKTNPRRAQTLGNLASMYASIGDNKRAKAMQEEVIADATAQFGPEATQTATAHLNLASTLDDLGEIEASLQHLERAKAIYMKALGPDAPPLANVHGALAEAHSKLGRPAEALANAERALAIREAGDTPPGYLAYTRFLVALALDGAGHRDRATAMGKRALELPLAAVGREASLAAQIKAWLAKR